MRFSDTILVTGSSGTIGSALIEQVGRGHSVVGFDRDGPPYPPKEAECIGVDLTSAESIQRALERVRYAYGHRIAAVVHLAAYYDFSGAESDLYQKLTVDGTRELLRQLQEFEVGLFIFSSTMLVHRPCQPGRPIDENWPLEGKWAYPQSKIEAERVLRDQAGQIPTVALRIAGVYDDLGHSIPIAHQIRRIDAERLTGRVYPGDTSRGQAFVHLDDTVEAITRCIERRSQFEGFTPILIGEEETLSYDELQRIVSRLLTGDEVETVEIPKPVARIGAWIQDHIPFGEEAFIKPWMISLADDHYELDISRAKLLLGWSPRHSLRQTLPKMIAALRRDPEAWYRENNMEPPPNSEAMEQARARPQPVVRPQLRPQSQTQR
jgi:nucleoside-diphosphate-sugar epimerase